MFKDCKTRKSYILMSKIRIDVLNIILQDADEKILSIEPINKIQLIYRVKYDDRTTAIVTVYPDTNGASYEWE